MIAKLAAPLTVCALVGFLGVSAPRPGQLPVRLTLPKPSLPTPIGVRTVWWTDASRNDPFVRRRRRELVVTFWYPAASAGRAPLSRYMPTGTARVFERTEGAPAGTFHGLRTHAFVSAAIAAGRHPVVLFSPAFGLIGSLYTTLLEDLAAHGFFVVSIDPTYEAFAVQFPGGRVVTRRLADRPNALQKSLAVRVADARFVLDRLSILSRRGRFARRLDLRRIGIVGHSMGGATAANMVLADSRVRAAADLDGSILGPVVGHDVTRPVMLLTSDGAYREDPTLQSLWAHLRGPRVRVAVVHSGHYTFSDLVTILPQFGPAVPPGLQYEPIGTIPASRALPAVRATVSAFLDRYIRGRPAPLLDRPSRSFAVLHRF